VTENEKARQKTFHVKNCQGGSGSGEESVNIGSGRPEMGLREEKSYIWDKEIIGPGGNIHSALPPRSLVDSGIINRNTKKDTGTLFGSRGKQFIHWGRCENNNRFPLGTYHWKRGGVEI